MYKPILIELHYLGNTAYYRHFCKPHQVHIEQHENYSKGSYRNRCYIAGGNGALRLSIPLQKGKHEQQAIREVRISYAEDWPNQHWRSICAAYGKSPFFEHYQEYFAPLYQQKFTFLFDFNLALLQCTLEAIGLEANYTFTKHFDKVPSDLLDLRNTIRPKLSPSIPIKNSTFTYSQVFEDRFGFLPNLSIIDLICCTGPQSLEILEKSIRV